MLNSFIQDTKAAHYLGNRPIDDNGTMVLLDRTNKIIEVPVTNQASIACYE